MGKGYRRVGGCPILGGSLSGSTVLHALSAHPFSNADFPLCCNSTELLLTAQLHNAAQLSAWCLHFVSSNYLAFHQLESFSLLTGDNLSHVEEHRWPPVSYEKAMEEWQEKHGGGGVGEEGEGKKGKQKQSKLMRLLRRTVAT